MQHGQLESDALVQWGMKDRTPWSLDRSTIGCSLVASWASSSDGQGAERGRAWC